MSEDNSSYMNNNQNQNSCNKCYFIQEELIHSIMGIFIFLLETRNNNLKYRNIF